MRPVFLPGRRRVLQALCASAATAGCSLLTRGPLEAPPPWFDPGKPRPPVVFIHGAFGSRLRNRLTGVEVFPAGLYDLLVGSYDALALPIDPDSGDALPDEVEAVGLFEDAATVEFYGSLVTMLARAGGYRREQAGVPVDDETPRFYACVYDWRQDFSRVAVQLDGLIEQVRADYGRPGMQVDLVAHSCGGLVARYYLLYGGRDLDQVAGSEPDFGGAQKVRRVVGIGTPELGIARAAAALVEGEPIVLNHVHPEVLATTHSPFQLLPHGDDAWLLDERGRPVAGDSCEVDLWRENGMSVFDSSVRARVRDAAGSRRAGRARLALLEQGFARRLERARRFREAIRRAAVPPAVPYFSIGGDCRPTQARLLVETTVGRRHARTRPKDVRWRYPHLDYEALMTANGDGTVTRASMACEPDWPVDGPPPPPAGHWVSREFVCALHNQLVVNADCQRALLHALGRDLPA
jgi:hypothetical protein